MKTYKDFEKSYIGSSDIASLTVRFPNKCENIYFGEDGSYKAYIITEEIELPAHYHKVAEGEKWIWIYDDEGLAFKMYAPEGLSKCEIYTAGAFGCIIAWRKEE